MNEHGRTETCFIGENTSLEALRHRLFDQHTDTAADERRRLECESEDRGKHRADIGNIQNQNHQRADNVDHCHKRHNDLRKFRNSAQAAENDQCGNDQKCNTEKQMDHVDLRSGNRSQRNVAKERRVHIQNDLIDLSHVTDTKGSKNRKTREKNRQNRGNRAKPLLAVALAHTVLQIVHRTAAPFSVSVFSAIINTEQIFRKVRHHSEKCRYPHPEHCAGTARDDCRGNARDITRTDGCGKSGTQRLELRNGFFIGSFRAGAVFSENTCYRIFPPIAKPSDLKKFRAARQQNTRANQKNQSGQAPDRTINRIVDRCHRVKKPLHKFPPQ